ncbi:hypothetical protein, partial [Pacificimonas flava]|uniref:hypothetical protein n=1 Tax=Pacificimonas flava TaxID=1234595 RepID=UPI00135F1B0A
ASILMGCGGEGSSPSTAAGTGRYPSFAEAVGGGAKAPGSATDAPETPVRAPEPGGVQVDPKPTIAFIKDGHSVELDCKESGTVTTHTGKYIYNDCGLTPEPLNAGGPQVDRGRVGLWLSESNPYWWAFDIGAFGHQDPNTSSNPSNVFVESEHRVSVNGGEPMTVRVAPASIKTLDNGTPVELTPARVRAAVEAHLLPRVDAGVYARYGMKFVAPTVDRVDYDPARIYSYDGRKSPFGDTSSTGGENYHGRAVMSEWDANLIRLALEDESVAFKKAADAYLNQMRWARSMPFETIQSRYGPHIRDPQKVVDPRDKPYVTAGRNEGVVIYNSGAEWQRPDDYPFYGSTSSSTRKHTRDLEHAHNMGEVWFAATGDPRAAMHLLARATWALSYPWEGWKSGDYTTMISPYVSERATLNFLRDTVLFTDILADTVKVDGKTPLWPKSRMESVRDETWKSWVKWRDERLAGDDQKSKMVRYFGDV